MIEIDTAKIAFKIPAGWEDQTNYTFRPADAGERAEEWLAVFEERARPGETAESLIADRLGQLGDGLGYPVTRESETTTTLDGVEARQGVIRPRPPGQPYHTYYAAAVREGWSCVIVLNTPVPREAEFARICASVSLTGAGEPGGKDAGYVRRRAKRASLLGPERFSVPRAYLLESTDGKLRLSVRVEETAEKAATVEEWLERDAQGADEVRERKSARRQVAGYEARELLYVLVHAGPPSTESYVRRAEFSVDQGRRLSLDGRAPASARGRLDQAWDEWLDSFVKR